MLAVISANERRSVAKDRTDFQQLGWTVGRDLKIETRQIGADRDSLRHYAAELVALAPDVIFSIGSVTVASLHQPAGTARRQLL
jgi:putative tryptophan/tyrosine transport system substrate-binding protein